MHMTKTRLIATRYRPATDTFGESWSIRYIDEGEIVDAATSDVEVGNLLTGLDEFAPVRLGLTVRQAKRRTGDGTADIFGAYRFTVVLAEADG